MNYDSLSTKFEKNGYLVIDDFFDTALMRRLHTLILDHFGDDPSFLHSEEFLTKAKTDVIPWFPQSEVRTEFDVIDEHQGLQQLTRLLLGDEWQRLYCMVMFSKQGTSGQAWHQDCAPEDPARYNLNRLV
jgi:ectoine hydroxylase-related dioxygenase (phytanoyl-CoA dioxygenase family)